MKKLLIKLDIESFSSDTISDVIYCVQDSDSDSDSENETHCELWWTPVGMGDRGNLLKQIKTTKREIFAESKEPAAKTYKSH